MKKNILLVAFVASFGSLELASMYTPAKKTSQFPQLSSSSSVNRTFSPDTNRSGVVTPRLKQVTPSPLMDRFSTTPTSNQRPRGYSLLTEQLNAVSRMASPMIENVNKGNFDEFHSIVIENNNKGFFHRAHTPGSYEGSAVQNTLEAILKKPFSDKNTVMYACLTESVRAASPRQQKVDAYRDKYEAMFKAGASIQKLQEIQRKIKTVSSME